MAYDPYSDERQSQSIGGMIAANANPMSLLGLKYRYDTSVYGGAFLDLNKGLWVPGMSGSGSYFKKLGKSVGEIGRAFKQGPVSGVKTTASQVFKFAEGTRVWASTLDVDKQALKTSTQHLGQLKKSFARSQAFVNKYESVMDMSSVDIKFQSAKKTGMQILDLDNFKKSINNTQDLISSQKWRIFKGRAMKVGLGAMKGVTMAMWGMTLWDMSKMIAEPLGRSLVENINRVSNEAMNRFSPEMGGKIALGYLSTGAATERQRAVEAISRSYINGRSALGQEAQLMHG